MTPASGAHDPAALAGAFLALADGAPARRRRARSPPAAVVLLTALVLAIVARPLVLGRRSRPTAGQPRRDAPAQASAPPTPTTTTAPAAPR